MRILHINCNYIGTTLHQLMIDELTALGIDNEVFVPVYDKNIAVIEPNANVLVSECFNKWDRILFDYKQNKILAAIETHYDIKNFDLIHAYTLFTDGNVARILSEKYGIPFVVAIRNTDVNVFLKKMPHLRSRGVKIMLKADNVFFLSESYKKQVFEKYVPQKYRDVISAKVDVIPNGIDGYWFDNKLGERTNYSSRIEEKKLTVIYAGVIDKNKNVTATCDAIDILRKKGWNIEFIVVGKIKDKSVFKKIAGRISYYQAKPKEELIALYRTSDIFVMPSLSESFGLVYVEAMTQGLPVVYSQGQGFDGQFEQGKVGYSVNAKSPSDIAEAITTICFEYDKISRCCINESSIFAWNIIVKKYINHYKRIVNKMEM